ncbi:MAG: PD-(D/E)XK nuclease domain-containing protein, partial [Puniceicoccales bacterium]|nr:PD-(D/E)XK nuclease domain-containing protein [Puniceicoccales bacterium]
ISEIIAGSTAEIPRVFDTLLAGIPYDDYVAAANTDPAVRRGKIGPREWLYRSSLLSFVRGTGLSVDAEIHNRHGRADMVIRGYGKTLVVEIKIAATAGDADAKLAEALTQIKERDYATQFPGALTLAIVIDDEQRKIAAWK